MNNINLIFITGLTASGKSDLAIWLAKKIDGEIINADSRQVYKFLDVGSGKIEIDKLKEIRFKNKKFIICYSKKFNIPHYLISQQHPKYNYSLGKWLEDIDLLIGYINNKAKKIIICGGTILYLRALKEGWQLPKVKPNYNLRKELEKLSVDELYKYLISLNKERAKNIDKNNKRRLIRAIEIIKQQGSIPELVKTPKYNILTIAPDFDWNKLENKIKKRLKVRSFRIILEILKLKRRGLSFERIINFGLEYRWFGLLVKNLEIKSFDYNKFIILKRDNFYQNIFENCYRDIRRFARKQYRELIKMKDLIWVKNKNDCLNIVKNYIN
ncbi:MAG: tRNA dimethylallyltransferase 2 [Candidatus Parcubacteria bacterium]|nr:MAG: tRNA dimethylallyltransferase 2 [Candidatus Parcubacteria bacterium]